MSWWWSSSRREHERGEERAAQVYTRREEMAREIVPLSEAGATVDDILVCLGCGHLVLRGEWPGWKGLHISHHAWQMATNPYVYPDWNSGQLVMRTAE
jgi:hypothetical protein